MNRMNRMNRSTNLVLMWLVLFAGLLLSPRVAFADVRVQDIARLQGQRTNKLMGFGLVVGLAGTGDGGKYANTVRALMALHRKYEQPVLEAAELRGNSNVAIVTVEVTIPEFGAREGQALDVTVSAIGPAKSLKGGQLLTTPLQESTLTVADVLALAGGRLELTDAGMPTRAVIRGGATLEQDFFYSFVEDGAITLVIDDTHAGYPFAQMLARAINHEIVSPTGALRGERDARGLVLAQNEGAVALGPKNVRVRIPPPELAQPAAFIARVLQTSLFILPQQAARVVINRSSKHVSFTGSVTLSPAVLQIPTLGTLTVGPAVGSEDADAEKPPGADFQALLDAMSKIKLGPDQVVATVEHLHRTGALHAQLIYTE